MRSVDDILTEQFPAYGDRGTATRWNAIKSAYALGGAVKGRIVAKFPFGLAVDIGAPLPGLLLVTRIPNLTQERYEEDPVFSVGTEIEAKVQVFAENQRQIGLTQMEDAEQDHGSNVVNSVRSL